MDILDDMGVSKLSAKVFLKWTTPLKSFCLKQAELSANGVRHIVLIQMENNIIFLTPLADNFACFKQKNYFFLSWKQDIIPYFLLLIK